MKIAHVCLAVFIGFVLVTGCRRQRPLDSVVLSYSVQPTFCVGCPHFRVELRQGGHATLFGLAGCAIPGEYYYQIPVGHFEALLREIDDTHFFSIPRLKIRASVADAPIKRIAYSDDVETHEVIEAGLPRPQFQRLEESFRKLSEVDRYLRPSVALYSDLLRKGWSVNSLGQDHENALLTSVIAGDVSSIHFLLQHGATVSKRALRASINDNSGALFRELAAVITLDYRSEEAGELLVSAAGSNLAVVRDLLDRGAPVNYRQRQNGPTALMAATPDQVEIAKLLIAGGANVDARDEMGRTALFRAAAADNTAMIDLLASSGANLNATDNMGRTALMTASDLCWYWDVNALLAHGADVTIRDRSGRSALQPNLVSVNDPNCDVSKRRLEETARRVR